MHCPTRNRRNFYCHNSCPVRPHLNFMHACPPCRRSVACPVGHSPPLPLSPLFPPFLMPLPLFATVKFLEGPRALLLEGPACPPSLRSRACAATETTQLRCSVSTARHPPLLFCFSLETALTVRPSLPVLSHPLFSLPSTYCIRNPAAVALSTVAPLPPSVPPSEYRILPAPLSAVLTDGCQAPHSFVSAAN